jgi:phospholipase/carboxylesterase
MSESALLPCVEVGPAGDAARSSVVWLHGLGASGHDFEPIAPLLGCPDTRFVFPHAPNRAVTINMGFVMPSWYDIRSLEPGAGRECEAQILESAVMIEALIAREYARGVPPDKLILAGFSQGGAMALHVGLRHANSLAGIMVLSAYALLEANIETEAAQANAQTPFLFGHGELDPVVPITRGRRAHELVSRDGRESLFRSYSMQHEVCPEQIADIADWLQARLGYRS